MAHIHAGESVPVRKVPYSPVGDGLGYKPDRSPACTLYSGTVVAQVIDWVHALQLPCLALPQCVLCGLRYRG